MHFVYMGQINFITFKQNTIERSSRYLLFSVLAAWRSRPCENPPFRYRWWQRRSAISPSHLLAGFVQLLCCVVPFFALFHRYFLWGVLSLLDFVSSFLCLFGYHFRGLSVSQVYLDFLILTSSKK